MDVLYWLTAVVYDFMNAGPGFPQVLLGFVLAGPLAVLLHELGHAVAARALLDEEVEVAVGAAGSLTEGREGPPVHTDGRVALDAARVALALR